MFSVGIVPCRFKTNVAGAPLCLLHGYATYTPRPPIITFGCGRPSTRPGPHAISGIAITGWFGSPSSGPGGVAGGVIGGAGIIGAGIIGRGVIGRGAIGAGVNGAGVTGAALPAVLGVVGV